MTHRSPDPIPLTALIPTNEAERLAALHRYQILDTPPESAFDRITSLAARLFQMPIALVSLVDESRGWFKSCYGFDRQETPRDATFCSFAVLYHDVLVVPDTLQDDRFTCNPFVQNEPEIRFYAGAPLLTHDGFNLGTLCVLDTQPHEAFSLEQQTVLADLAAIVIDELELRLAARQVIQQELVQRENEAQLQRALQVGKMGTWDWNLQTGKIVWSEGHFTLLGLQSDQCEPSYAIWLNSLHPEDRESTEAALQWAITERIEYRHEYRTVWQDGSIHWVEARGSFSYDAAGQPIQMVGVLIDITDRKQAEAALRQSEEQSCNILESITDAFFALNENWQFTYINPSAEALLDRTPGELAGKNLWEEYPGLADNELARIYWNAMRDRVTASMTAFYPDHDRWYEVRTYPAPNGISVYFRNVTDQIQAETALQASEERYRSLVTATSSIVWVAAGNGEILSAPEWETFTGQTPEQYKGWGWFDMVHPDNRETTTRIWSHAIENKIPCEVEHRLMHRDGQYRHTIARAVPILDAAGSVREWIGTVTDITERKQAEDTLRDREAQLVAEASALVRLNEASSRLWRKLNLSEGLNEMLGATIELLGADMGNIQLLDIEQGVLRIAVQQGFQQDFLDFFREVSTEDDSACGRMIRSGERTIIEDVETDAPYAPLRPIARAAGYRAVQSMPLLGRDGIPLGVLSTHWRSPHRPSDQDLRRLDLYVRQAADFIESIRAEAALRQSEAKYRSLFESIDQGFCLLEVLFDADEKPFDYRFVETNEAFEQQSSLTDAVGKTILELVPNLEPQWAGRYGQVVKSGEAVRFEADVPSMNHVFDIDAFPSGAPGQNLVAVLFTDITQRKRREANLAFLAEVQDDCARLTTAEEMMQTIGAKIGAYLNLSICAFVDVDEAQDQAIVSCCWHRADVPNLVGTYRISNFVSEEFYIAARAGVVVIVNDTNTDARTDAASCAALKIQSFIHVPFLRDGQWKFLFNVYDSCPRNWRKDEIELFSELANRIFPRLERARAEVALRQSEERYRTLFNSIDEGFCVVEVIVDSNKTPVDYRILEVNPVFEQQSGIPQAVGKTARELNLEEHWIETYGQVALTGEAVRFKSGSEVLGRWFDVYACRTGEPEGRKVAIVFKDISDRKRAEAEREQLLQREQTAREAAENANRVKDEFLAVLSHELRSPLNPILGWTSLLKNGKLDAARQVVALNTIERNAQLQAQLISDLLDVSRILRGKLSLETIAVNLGAVILAAMETVRLAAEAKSLQIQTMLPPAGVSVVGDAGRLQQVVWNLLSNAVKFTPTGGQITIALTQTDTDAQITVSDTGKGIKHDFLPYVFEHFRQEDGATTRKFGGLGLGLAIARQIVEMHGGQISVDSPGEGQGATFTVQLPLAPHVSELPATESSSASMSDLNGIHILVVDDEIDSREIVAFVLEQTGAVVTSVSSGIEALQAIEQFTPDLIVSDIGMPDMDGYMLLQQIRGLEPTRHVPAIALTAYAGEFDRQRAIAAGFQQHLAKPVEPDALVRAIATLTGGNQHDDRSGG